MSRTPRRKVSSTASNEDTTLKRKEYARLHYQKNRDKIREKHNKYYADNKERIIEYRRKYHLENRERLIQKARQWRLDNLEKRNAYSKQWKLDNPEKHKIYNLKSRKRIKVETLDHYGGQECVCCGETRIEFLTLDHINGGGNTHRKEIGNRGGYNYYSWLKKNNYPRGYQVMCMNCNHSRGHYGYCPHNSRSTFLDDFSRKRNPRKYPIPQNTVEKL